MSARLRLMAVHAHPDDESSKGAATMARYASEGVDVMVVTCTGGERGDILNPALADDPEVLRDVPARRRAEMAEAARILGVRQHWLGFVDSGLPEGDPLPPLPEGCFALEDLDVTTARLVEVVRRFRPHVVLTYDENGGYPHPDHVMTHKVAVAAYHAAGDATYHPDAGEPWTPLKLYYDRTMSMAKLLALHEAAVAEGIDSPFAHWIERREAREKEAREKGEPAGPADREATTHVRCADWFDVRDRALLAHATQIDPNGWFFAVPLDLQRRVWPTEDYELVHSRVPVQLPETDLFAGVPEAGGDRAATL